MKLPRPYIPLAVRASVARRQFHEKFPHPLGLKRVLADTYPAKRRLGIWLRGLFHDEPYHLDHDPALCNREFNSRTGKYIPDANDPDFLIYRATTDHNLKTRVHGDGAQLSDLALRRKFKRIEKRKLAGKRAKYGGRR